MLDALDEEIARYYWEHINALALLGKNDEHIDYFLSRLLKFSVVSSMRHSGATAFETKPQVYCRCFYYGTLVYFL